MVSSILHNIFFCNLGHSSSFIMSWGQFSTMYNFMKSFFSFLTCRCYTGNHCHSNQLSGKLNFLQLSERHLLIKDFSTNMRLHDQFNFKFSIHKKNLLPKENGKFSRLTWPQEAWKRQQTPNPPAHPPTNQSLSTQIHQEINPNQLRNQPKSGAAQPPSNQTFLQFNSYFL